MSDYPTAQDIARYRRHDNTPDLSPAEAAIVARFESAVTPPEVVEARVVEEVARAMHGKTVTVVGYEARTTMTAVGPLGLESARDIAAAAVAAYRAAQDGGAEEAVLVEGDWIVPSREAHARDLTKSWADAAQNAGCPSAFVSRMRAFVDVHDRNYRAALAPQAGDDYCSQSGLGSSTCWCCTTR